MLIFSYKLEKYIKTKILPKILLDSSKYNIKGSFRRRIPYVTDVDIVNDIYPKINENNIYEELLKLIDRIKEDKNIILVYITCGIDDRFKIETGTKEELDKIKNLLYDDDKARLDLIVEKYANNANKRIFYISEIIWKYYKLRWTPKNIIDNKMILKGNVQVKFTDIIKANTTILLQYYVKIESYPIGIDVVSNYKPFDFKNAYQLAADYQLKFANYGKEYYFMLFPFKFFFKNNKKISQELENIIEKKFGLYKQLLVRIDTYHMLYDSQNLDIQTATSIVTSIVKDIKQLSIFSSNAITEIQKVSMDNSPNTKMEKWYLLLNVLYDEINATTNSLAKDYFFIFLDMVPNDIKSKYHLADYRFK